MKKYIISLISILMFSMLFTGCSFSELKEKTSKYTDTISGVNVTLKGKTLNLKGDDEFKIKSFMALVDTVIATSKNTTDNPKEELPLIISINYENGKEVIYTMIGLEYIKEGNGSYKRIDENKAGDLINFITEKIETIK